MPFLDDPASFVQFVMALGLTIMGISHIVQPEMWREFFSALHAQGKAGVVTKIMLVELWPALAIVSLHQVWSGPAILLTIYGWALLAKVALSLTMPRVAMRGMTIPDRLPRSFIPGGFALLVIAGACVAALFWPQ